MNDAAISAACLYLVQRVVMVGEAGGIVWWARLMCVCGAASGRPLSFIENYIQQEVMPL